MASSCRWPRGVEVLPQAVQVVGRVTRGEALELGVDGEAVADLHLAVGHTGVEAVEGTDRRAAEHLALEALDAAVARADELLGGLLVADRAAQVGAARGYGDVRLWVLALDDLVDLPVEAA